MASHLQDTLKRNKSNLLFFFLKRSTYRFLCVSLCWPHVSFLPHKGLIICTSTAWESSLEKTHGAHSDRSIVQNFLSVLHSIGDSAAFAPTHLLFFFFHTSCLDVGEKKKKKKEPQKASQGLASSVCCLHMLCNTFTAKGRVDGGRRRLWRAALKPFQAIVSHRPHLRMHTGPVFVWFLANPEPYIVCDIGDLRFAQQDDFFFFLPYVIGPDCCRSLRSVWFWSCSRSTCAFGKK